MREIGHFVGGKEVKGNSGRFGDIFNPNTGEVQARAPLAAPEEVDAAVKDLLTALEPIMIVFLGLVVGGVVISMYLPLFSLIGKLSGH